MKTPVFIRGVTKQDVISLITDNGVIPGRAKSLIQQNGVLKIILDKQKKEKQFAGTRRQNNLINTQPVFKVTSKEFFLAASLPWSERFLYYVQFIRKKNDRGRRKVMLFAYWTLIHFPPRNRTSHQRRTYIPGFFEDSYTTVYTNSMHRCPLFSALHRMQSKKPHCGLIVIFEVKRYASKPCQCRLSIISNWAGNWTLLYLISKEQERDRKFSGKHCLAPGQPLNDVIDSDAWIISQLRQLHCDFIFRNMVLLQAQKKWNESVIFK